MLGIYKNGASDDDEAIANQIYERSVAGVMSQLCSAAQQMSAAELRGYIRALALPLIQSEAQQFVRSGQMQNARMNKYIAQVLERTVHELVRGHTSAPVAATPAPHIGLRTAA